MAAPFMDERIMYRKSKMGFNSPMSDWLKGDMKEYILDMVHSQEFYECELLNSLDAKIRVDEFYKCEKNTFADGEGIWTLLVPYLWKNAMRL